MSFRWQLRVIASAAFLALASLLTTGVASADTFREPQAGRPALTFNSTNGLYYVAWTGSDSSHSVNVAVWDYLTSSLVSKNKLDDTTIYGAGPAMTSHNGAILIAWAGSDNPSHIYMGVYRNSSLLDCHTRLNEATYESPVLATDGSGQVYLAWTGTDTAHHVNIAKINDQCSSGHGLSLSNKVTLADTSVAGPAIGQAPNGSLDVAWAGTDSAHHIWTGIFTGSTTLAHHTQTPYTTTAEPGLSDDQGTTALYYMGTDSAHTVYRALSNDGTSFGSNAGTGNTTVFGVSTANASYAFAGTDAFWSLNIM